MSKVPLSTENTSSHTLEEEKALLKQLREIILSEDRVALKTLQDTLDDPTELNKKIAPIIHQHLSFIKENFSSEYGESVREITKSEILNSKDEIMDLIAPNLGTMIQKYVTSQFQKLKENVDNQVKNVKYTFSFSGIINRLLGPSETDIILSKADQPKILEIYLIQKNSGLLLGSYSKEENLHQDVVAGMLTAIKAFAEDALEVQYEHLEMIQYDNYKIFLQDFSAYYFAVAISGSLSTSEKEILSNKIITFAEKYAPLNIKQIDSALTTKISNYLKKEFESFSIIT